MPSIPLSVLQLSSGTPEGGHVATKQQKNSKDDSVYHSDLSLDSDLDSLPMDIVTSVKEPPGLSEAILFCLIKKMVRIG